MRVNMPFLLYASSEFGYMSNVLGDLGHSYTAITRTNPQSQKQSSVTRSHVACLSNMESALKTPSRINQSDENEKLANEIKQRESDLSAKQKELRQLEAKVKKNEDK